MPTEDQIKHLNGMLALLSGGYKAEIDPANSESTMVTCDNPSGDARITHELTLDYVDFDDGCDTYSVGTLVTSGGGWESPPDVDYVELAPPCGWSQACENLVMEILKCSIQHFQLKAAYRTPIPDGDDGILF